MFEAVCGTGATTCWVQYVWCQYKEKDVKVIEAVQTEAAKLVLMIKNLSYKERPRKLELPTLTYWILSKDMVETYKIINGAYDSKVCEGLFEHQTGVVTWGHIREIYKQRLRLNIKKHTFYYRLVNNWNNLPDIVINLPWWMQYQCWIFKENWIVCGNVKEKKGGLYNN